VKNKEYYVTKNFTIYPAHLALLRWWNESSCNWH